MRKMTDLKPQKSGRTPNTPLAEQPLDLRGKDSGHHPTRSRHIIDLGRPTKNRQQLHEHLRRNSFFEAIPLASVGPFSDSPLLSSTGEEREGWSDRLTRYNAGLTTTLARHRRHWRSRRRRGWFEAGVLLTVWRQQTATWWRSHIGWRRLTVAAMLILAGVMSIWGLSLLLTPQPTTTNQPTPTTQGATSTETSNSGADPGGGGTVSDGETTDTAANGPTPVSAPLQSVPTAPDRGAPTVPACTGCTPPTGGGTPVVIPPVTVPPLETPLLDTPTIQTPVVDLTGGLL